MAHTSNGTCRPPHCAARCSMTHFFMHIERPAGHRVGRATAGQGRVRAGQGRAGQVKAGQVRFRAGRNRVGRAGPEKEAALLRRWPGQVLPGPRWALRVLREGEGGSILALSRHRRRHVYCAGMGVPVLKMTASPSEDPRNLCKDAVTDMRVHKVCGHACATCAQTCA